MKLLLSTIACLLLLSNITKAQSLPDKLNINTTYVLPGDVAFQRNNNDWSYMRNEITLYKKPKNLMKKTLVFHGFGYVNNQFSFGNESGALAGLSNNFHDLRYTIIMSSRMKNKRWTWLNAARVTVRSDFKNRFVLGEEVFPFFQSVPQYSFRKDGRFKAGLGISLNNDLGYYVIAPTAVINYRSKNSKFTADLVYPNLTLLHRPNKRTEWGMIANVEGGIYRMERLAGVPAANHFRHLQLSAAPILNYKLNPKKPHWISVRAGYTFLRRVELLNNKYDAVENIDLDADNNLLFRAGWVWRFM
jgi:hypothetical protein